MWCYRLVIDFRTIYGSSMMSLRRGPVLFVATLGLTIILLCYHDNQGMSEMLRKYIIIIFTPAGQRLCQWVQFCSAVLFRCCSNPPPPAPRALFCWELLCGVKEGAYDAAVALQWCLWWQTWSMMLLSWASLPKVIRSWWCVWLCRASLSTHVRSLTWMCWISFTGGWTCTEQHRALRCKCSFPARFC